MNRELVRLVERYGGVALSAPALREVAVTDDAPIAKLLDGLTGGEFDAVVLPTGVSVTRLAEHADHMDRRAELISGLKRVTTVCRGPKPVAALRTLGVQASLVAREPFTTAEVLDAIAPLHTTHRRFALLHYGDRNQALVETLCARGASVEEVVLYLWEMPEDTSPLRDLISQIMAGAVDALAITCQVQVTHLFRVAAERALEGDLAEALNERVVIAAVGPRCRAALEKFGVHPDVIPDHPKLGPMVAALARHIERVAEPGRV
jgi:uroporphyrinogen-III synthase